MKTILHSYYYNLSNHEESQAYKALCDNLHAQELRCFSAWGGKGSYHMPQLDGQEIELETKFLFSNQWNTAPVGDSKTGYRVFDWAEDYQLQNKSLKTGHWLEQTPAMKSIRESTYKCGYCGKHYFNNAPQFCMACIDSEYLTEKDLYLLRTAPIIPERKTFPPLNEEELAYLLPLYRKGQLEGITERGKTRRAQERHDLDTKYQQGKRTLETEYQGMLWLWKKGIKLDNVIYYSHTNKFCFGWRTPIDPDLKSRLLDILSEFPYTYEFKER